MEEDIITVAREIVRRQNVSDVLRENGISEPDFVRWLEGGEAAEYLYRMARLRAMAKVPELWMKLEQMAAEGDLKAMKLYCDLCERCDRGKSEDFSEAFSNHEVDEARKAVFGDE